MLLYGSMIYQGMTQHLGPGELSDDNSYIEILTTKFEATKQNVLDKTNVLIYNNQKTGAFDESNISLTK